MGVSELPDIQEGGVDLREEHENPIDMFLSPRVKDRIGDHRVLGMISIIYVLMLALLIMGSESFSYFQIFYALLSLAYLIFLLSLYRSKILGRFTSQPLWVQGLVIIGLAGAVRVAFLALGPGLSEDIFRIEARVDLLLSGSTPYEDFTVNKPPLYILFIGIIGRIFGNEIHVYRAVFLLLDVAVASLILLAPRLMHWKGSWGGFAAIAYALCPIVLLETSLGSHYDPIVVLIVLLAVILAVRGVGSTSGFLLGLGFGLKLYPILLLPIVVLRIKDVKQKGLAMIGFSLGASVGFIPFLLMGNTSVLLYLKEQSVEWNAGNTLLNSLIMQAEPFMGESTIRYLFIFLLLTSVMILVVGVIYRNRITRTWMSVVMMMWMLQLSIIFMLNVNVHGVSESMGHPITLLVNTLIFLIAMAIPWVLLRRTAEMAGSRSRMPKAIFNTFYLVASIFPLIFLVTILTSTALGGLGPWRFYLGMIGIVMIVTYPLITIISSIRADLTGLSWTKFPVPLSMLILMLPFLHLGLNQGVKVERTSILKEILSIRIDDRTMMLASFILITLLLFFSSQFHPWYILWLIPFLLLSKDKWAIIAFLPLLIMAPSLLYGPRDFPPIYGIPTDVLDGLRTCLFV